MKKIIFIALVFTTLVTNAQLKDVLVPYRKASLWGFSDSNGKIVIAPVYDSVTLFERVYNKEKEISIKYCKVYQNNKVGMLSNDNKFLFPIQYASFDFEYDSDRFTITDANGKSGLRDFNTVYLPIEYESIKAVRNESYVIQKNGKIGLADYYGKIVIPMIYDQLNYVSKDEKSCKWKVVNEQETKYVFTPIFEEKDQIVSEYSIPGDAPYAVEVISAQDELTKKYNWVEKHGIFDYAFIFREESKSGYKYGFENSKSKNKFKGMDSKLEFLIDYFDYKTRSQHFVLKISKEDKYGIIDETGTIIIPTQYNEIQSDRKKCTLIKNDLIGYYFPHNNQFFEAKYKGSTGYANPGSYSLVDFTIIGVYENSKKDWYYIGDNGVIFKE
ncbi:WG repeat-containing protein [Flavobacterium sp.]|uniref:WG repeat-containing protein n=1 Tax=Flavobacterium sp. TaxID=239 RepID=UPI002622A7C2|nr:WG repeat-containing protein [Flavobacterium sp.]